MKPIFAITTSMPLTYEQRDDIWKRLDGYHVIFMHGEEKCQLFSVKETIELTDLKQLQDYLDTHK